MTQRLQHVEARLGARLIDRSSRRLALTDDGIVVLARARTVLAGLSELEEELDARRGLLSGTLRVLAPLGFGRAYVAPTVTAMRAKHPALSVELTLSDRVGRLTADAWDIAIHIGALPDTSLSRIVLAPNDRWLCASPRYLERVGPLGSVLDLKQHVCIALRQNDEDVTSWRFTRRDETFVIRIEPALSTNDGDIAKAWCLDGGGIILRSEWHVAAEVNAGRLVRLLPDFKPPDADVVALAPSKIGRTGRVDAFIATMRNALQPTPWRQ